MNGREPMAKVHKRTLPSGVVRWQADYRDMNGRRRRKLFNRKSDADDWLHRTKVAVADGVHVAAADSLTVSQAAALWLDTCENENALAAATMRQYKQHVKNYIESPEFGIGAVRLTSLTAGRVKQFFGDVVKNRSRIMAEKTLKSLRGILSDAQVRGKVAVNVSLAFKPARVRRTSKAATLPPRAALRNLLGYNEPKWRTFFTVAILTGLRGQELRGLQWSDVDFAAGVIHVRRAADINADLKQTKSVAGERDVPMAPMVSTRLKSWKLECQVTDLDLVFPNQAGKVMAQNCIDQNVWRELDPGFRFHDLRHAAASLFIEAEMPPKRLCEVMGHSSIQVTFDLYGHLWPDQLGAAAIVSNAQDALFANA